MSISEQLKRVIGLKDNIATKLKSMGLISSSETLEDCKNAIEEIIDNTKKTSTSIAINGTFHSGQTGAVFAKGIKGYSNENSLVKVPIINLRPENIKKGVNVGGVVGTFTVPEGSLELFDTEPLYCKLDDNLFNPLTYKPIRYYYLNLERNYDVSYDILFNSDTDKINGTYILYFSTSKRSTGSSSYTTYERSMLIIHPNRVLAITPFLIKDGRNFYNTRNKCFFVDTAVNKTLYLNIVNFTTVEVYVLDALITNSFYGNSTKFSYKYTFSIPKLSTSDDNIIQTSQIIKKNSTEYYLTFLNTNYLNIFTLSESKGVENEITISLPDSAGVNKTSVFGNEISVFNHYLSKGIYISRKTEYVPDRDKTLNELYITTDLKNGKIFYTFYKDIYEEASVLSITYQKNYIILLLMKEGYSGGSYSDYFYYILDSGNLETLFVIDKIIKTGKKLLSESNGLGDYGFLCFVSVKTGKAYLLDKPTGILFFYNSSKKFDIITNFSVNVPMAMYLEEEHSLIFIDDKKQFKVKLSDSI